MQVFARLVELPLEMNTSSFDLIDGARLQLCLHPPYIGDLLLFHHESIAHGNRAMGYLFLMRSIGAVGYLKMTMVYARQKKLLF